VASFHLPEWELWLNSQNLLPTECRQTERHKLNSPAMSSAGGAEPLFD
jgi:hypothetical protein